MADVLIVEETQILTETEEIIEILTVAEQGPPGPVGPIGPEGPTSWAGVTDKPETFPPSAHSHALQDVVELEAALLAKVDKVAGKGLSTEDYTTAEKSKLSGIAAGATANATDAQLRDRATHTGTQAISTIAGLQVALDAKEAAGTAAAAVASHTAAGDPHPQYTTSAEAAAAAPVQSVAGRTGAVTLTKADVGLSNVDNTSDANKPISTATQTALNAKVDKVAGKGLSTEDYTTAEKTKLAGVEAGAQVNTVTSVAGKTGAVVLAKADVGLANVDNTSDASKPVSTATQTALNSKEGTIASGTTSQFWRGDKTWRDFFTDVRAATLTGLSTATSAAVSAADTVLAAIGKLQAQVNARVSKSGDTMTGALTLASEAIPLTVNNLPTARPSLLLDFVNTRGIDPRLVDPRITFTRSSTATRTNEKGLLETVAANGPRIDFDPVSGACRGLLIEEARTNYITNNTMQGVVIGSPGTTPTGWQVAGTGSGITRSVVATGEEDGISYVDIRFNGTPAVNNATVGFTAANAITAASGQVWAISTYLRLVGGSFANTSTALDILETDGTNGVGANQAACVATSAPLATQRFVSVTTVDANGVTHVQPRVRIGLTIGQPVDFTLRIGLPQFELGGSATSVIRTTGAAATRAADVPVMTGTNFSSWYRQDEGTFVVEGSTSDLSASRGLWAIGDPTLAFGSRSSIYSAISATTGSWLVSHAVNGVSQISSSALAGNFSAGVALRTAYAYKSNDSVGSNNGAIGTPDNLCDVPYTANFGLSIGTLNNGWSDGGSQLNGHIRRIAYYPKRLSNAQLQALTTP